jgi:hypothetical protein
MLSVCLPRPISWEPTSPRSVTDPAVIEVNGLSDMVVDLTDLSIASVAVTCWRKQGNEFKAAMRELSLSKIGRMARVRGQVEEVSAASVFREQLVETGP